MPDHSALSQPSRDLIAAAELEAQSIYDAFHRDARQLEHRAFDLGVDLSGIGYSPGDIPLDLAAGKREEGAQQAAAHLFNTTVEQYWRRWNPNIEAFLAELDSIWRSAHQRFGIRSEMPTDIRLKLQAQTLRMRAASVSASEPSADGDRSIHKGEGAPMVQESPSPGPPRKKAKSAKPFLFERLSPDDPNYDLIKNSFIKSWADSNGHVADAFAGEVSLSHFIEQSVNTFDQGAKVHIALKDAGLTSERCQEIDRMAKKSIALIRRKIAPEAKRLGRRNVKAATEEFSRRVGEVAARSKQAILQDALGSGDDPSIGEIKTRRPSSEVLRDFNLEFDALMKRENELLAGRRDNLRLCASCMYPQNASKFGSVSVEKGVNRALIDRFVDIGTRVGIELGGPANVKPVEFWTHCLYQDLLKIKGDEVFAPSAEGGMIVRLIESSASFCLRLAIAADEHAHREGVGAQTTFTATTSSPLGGTPPVNQTGFLHERMHPNDSNYDLIRRFELNTWAEWGWELGPHFSRHASVRDYLDSASNTLERGLELLISLNAEIPASERCKGLESFKDAAIQTVHDTLTSKSKALGESSSKAAIHEFSAKAKTLYEDAKKKLVLAELDRDRTRSGSASDVPESRDERPPLPERETMSRVPTANQEGRSDSMPGEAVASPAGVAFVGIVAEASAHEPKKRGRPVSIDKARKETALAARDRRASWKEVAKILYSSPYPTPQQVKNSPNVLNNYKRTRVAPPENS